MLLQFTVNNSFSAFHVFILEYKIVAFSVDVSILSVLEAVFDH